MRHPRYTTQMDLTCLSAGRRHDTFAGYSPVVSRTHFSVVAVTIACAALLTSCSDLSVDGKEYQAPVESLPTASDGPPSAAPDVADSEPAPVSRQGGSFTGTNSARTQRIPLAGSYRVDWTISGTCMFTLYLESSASAPGQINTQVATNAYELASGKVGRDGVASPVTNVSFVYDLPDAQYNAFASTTSLDRCSWSFELVPEG